MTLRIRRDLSSFVLHFFGFLLLWEWLRPLNVVTDTAELQIFVIFIGICFLLLFLKVNVWISTVIKVLVILYMLHSTYFQTSLFDSTWLSTFIFDLTHNVGLLLQANWWEMSAIFRSFLFFILLWLMSYLIYHWLIVQRRIFTFFVLTVVYITILDTFSPYDANGAIIRTVVFGFMMLGILNIERIIGHEKLVRLNGILTKWAVPLLVFIVLTSTFGYFAPKAAPQWPDPVPYLKGYGKGGVAPGGEGRGIKKIGYGTNDSYLGGPFIADDTPVFKSIVGKRHYWRIETKDMYTGKGWEVSENLPNQEFTSENNIVSWFEEKAEIETYEAEVFMLKQYPHINYPAGLKTITLPVEYPGLSFNVDPLTEKIVSRQGDTNILLSKYSMTYEQPVYQVQDLQLVTSGGGLERVPGFLETYTQLPETLPDRVRELAAEITADKTNRYDKVTAVERYFKDHSFVYDTQNVAVPGKNDDYVDQFLFETKSGYCDNFSTSMIVLLRSLDIPARWVKGYTEGTYQETLDYNRRIFEITNNNAHSWVEVYFPGHGWISFEPTKGFSNLSSFVYNTSATVNNQNNQETETPAPAQEPLEDSLPEFDQGATGTTTTTPDLFKNFSVSFKDVFFILLSLVLVVYVFVKTRLKWFPIAAILLYKYRRDGIVYFKAYQSLLKQLERTGLKRQEGQTLREYAVYVDRFYHSNDMQALTRSYERALYRKDNAETEWAKSVELWENLIKKVSS